MALLFFFHPSIALHLDKPVTFFFSPATNTYERRIKMKNIGKIIIATFLAMFLVVWAFPSEARNGRARSGQRKHYNNGQKKHYKIGHRNHYRNSHRKHYRTGHRNHYKYNRRNHRVHGYHHYYPRNRYSHYRSHYKPHYYPYGHYSHLGLHLSPHGTRIHIRLGF